LIDLHTHTNASDGLYTPDDLVARAARAGVMILSVTDHDTVASSDAAKRACLAAGLTFVPGIEITAIMEDTDVHMLGYFIDVGSVRLSALLDGQRQSRIDRTYRMIERLARHGLVLDADAILRPALDDPGRTPGRPWIARALVAAGHVPTVSEAFSIWLARGRPAFVPRFGPAPREVIASIHLAGGLASLAHPGLLKHDEWIQPFVADGLDALEAFHSEHDRAASARYLQLANSLGLAVSGGSDFHGEGIHGVASPGQVSLPRDEYDRLLRLRSPGSYT
jgi:predicted metal-dependent phosphoesterase TrpH